MSQEARLWRHHWVLTLRLPSAWNCDSVCKDHGLWIQTSAGWEPLGLFHFHTQAASLLGGGEVATPLSASVTGGGRGLPPTYFGILHKQEAYLDGGWPMKLEVFGSLVQKTKPNLEATRGTEQPSQEDREKNSKINFRKTGRKPLVT